MSINKKITATVLVIVVFVIGFLLGDYVDNSEPDYLESYDEMVEAVESTETVLTKLYPSGCTDNEDAVNCEVLFDNDYRTTDNWTVVGEKCEDSVVEVTLEGIHYVEFVVIDKFLKSTSSNVEKFAVETTTSKKIFNLNNEGQNWIDINEEVFLLKFSIESLYESSQLSDDCGISEITIFGRDS